MQEEDDDDRESRKKSLILFSTKAESLPIVSVPVHCALKDKVAKPNDILRETWISSWGMSHF